MKQLLSIIVFLVSSSIAVCQPIVEWMKSYGSIKEDMVQSFVQTSDNGYIIAGSRGLIHDIWIVKTDSIGNIQWQQILSGTDNDDPTCIRQTQDGGYIITGYTSSHTGTVTSCNAGGYDDGWIAKLSATGTLMWKKCFGGSLSERFNGVIQTADLGYIVIGFSSSADGDLSGISIGSEDYLVVKYDASGNVLWKKCYGGARDDIGNSIVQTATGGYVIAGQTSSADGDVTGWHTGGGLPMYPTSDFWVLGTDSSGNILWNKCYGGSDNEIQYSLAKTADGGYLVAGETSSSDFDITDPGYGSDYWVIKIGSTGALLWQKVVGGNGVDMPYSVQETQDGNCVVAGYSNSTLGDISYNHGYSNAWIVKLDVSSGNIIWEHCYGGNTYEYAQCIIQTSDLGFAFAGASFSTSGGEVTGVNNGSYDMWLVKLSGITLSNLQSDICGQCLGTATATLLSGTPPYTYAWSNGGSSATANNLCQGMNTVSVTDSAGNTLSGYFLFPNDSVTLSISQIPASCWSCPDGTATLTASGGSGVYTYSWPGHPDTTATLSGWPHGWVTGCVTDSLGCMICKSVEIQSPTGISEINTDDVLIFPVPAYGTATIISPGSPLQKIRIMNITGDLIIEESISGEKQKVIDLIKLPMGVYFIEITTEKGVINKKMIKN